MLHKLLKILPIPLLLPAHFIQAASECVSGSGGYCVNLAGVAYAQGIPGLEFLKATTDFGQLISNIYVFGMGLVAISALVVLVAAGVWYMSAGDNAGRAGEAKKWMGNAIFGLVLALLSWLILYTINPDLIKKAGWMTNLIKINEAPGIENIKMNSVSKSEFSKVQYETNLQKEEQQSILNDPNTTGMQQPVDKTTEQPVNTSSNSPAEKQQILAGPTLTNCADPPAGNVKVANYYNSTNSYQCANLPASACPANYTGKILCRTVATGRQCLQC
ncbi:MAG: hypothetical protein HYT98_03785 [Candidatus Sungbacteria bacterium]|nr:hypothetical protein [Candidatus Sungbacteria bacterium]